MPETFKCPACSAPLEFEGTTMQKCRFCGSNVIVPSDVIRESRSFGGAGVIDFGDLSDLTGKALKIAEIRKLIDSGNKIMAIKVYRETFGTGLAESKAAVDAIERGESVDISGMRVKATNVSGVASGMSAQNAAIIKKAAFGIGGSIIGIFVLTGLLIFGILAFVFFMVSRTVNQVKGSLPSVSTPAREATPKPDEPETLAEVLKFGGEGIGAGKFKDNRTVAVGGGRIFSADIEGGRVQAFDMNGAFQTVITADTTRTVDKLAVDRKGTLFVKQGYDIFRFEPESGRQIGKTRVDYAADMAIGIDGKIYVPTRRGEIVILGADGERAGSIKISPDLNLNAVEGLVVDGAGSLFVLDGRNYAVFKLSADGKFLNRFGGRGERLSNRAPKGQFHGRPMDLAVDSQGRLYVAEIDRISVFDSTGGFLKDFKTSQAFGLAIDDKDRIFVASRPYVVLYQPFSENR